MENRHAEHLNTQVARNRSVTTIILAFVAPRLFPLHLFPKLRISSQRNYHNVVRYRQTYFIAPPRRLICYHQQPGSDSFELTVVHTLASSERTGSSIGSSPSSAIAYHDFTERLSSKVQQCRILQPQRGVAPSRVLRSPSMMTKMRGPLHLRGGGE